MVGGGRSGGGEGDPSGSTGVVRLMPLQFAWQCHALCQWRDGPGVCVSLPWTLHQFFGLFEAVDDARVHLALEIRLELLRQQ